MATRLQAIIDFAYKAGGIENAIGDMGKLAQGIGQVGRSATQMSVESAALDARTSLLSDKMNKLAVAVAQNKMTVEAATSEYQRFESKLISIPPAVDKTESSFQRMKSALGNAKDAWMAMATPIQSTIQTLQQVGQTAQQAYEFVSEGTQLVKAQDQFAALSSSIGSTASVMLSELRTATRGTISDFELMRSAGSIMSLGLADTEEGVVRLGAVVGKLGWDMNQVTLTIANQSTMRLDSLGLSVSDVEARVEAFKEQGYATDEAFKFAIIEAGEAKVRLLGDAADTAAGKLAILETNAANLKDNFQATFSQELVQHVNDMAGGLFETEEAASGLGKTLGQFGADVIRQWFDPVGMANERLEESKGKFDAVNTAVTQASSIMPKLNDAFMAQREAVITATAAVDGWMASMNTVTTMTPQAIQQLHQQAAAIYQETSPAYAELQDKITQTSTQYDMNVQAVRAANLANQQMAGTMPMVSGAIYATSEAVAAYNARLGEYYMAAQNTDAANLLINSGIRETSGGMVEMSNLTKEQSDDLDRMQSAYEKAAQTIRDYELGVKGANMTDEERNKKIEEQQTIMATLSANMEPLIAAGSQLVAVQGQMVGFGPAVADAFMQSASAMGANANQLAAMQLAFSDMAPAQAEAILKEAALAAEVQKLTQEIMDGNMTVYEARDAYIAFQNGLNDSTIAVNSTTGSVLLMNDSMISSASSTQTLLDKFGEFPEMLETEIIVEPEPALTATQIFINKLMEIPRSIPVDIVVNGEVPKPTGGYQAPPDAGGPQGPGYASGADFVVPPGYPNDSFPMRVQSGEHVTVTPAGQQRGGNTYNLYVTAMDGGANVSREFNYLKSLAGA